MRWDAKKVDSKCLPATQMSIKCEVEIAQLQAEIEQLRASQAPELCH